mmetsp:Transcript_15633/g.28045  ORF Transcript_15633/g.28045 Transcript_15633/m.28045 type:complete len:215 (+) Transcript_15633:91-735(+)
MSDIELLYFNIAGKARFIRLAFAIGGVEFKDTRLSRDGFNKAKEAGECPYGQLPVLKVKGEALAQSTAILRYVGKITGLYPEDPILAAKVDSYMDLVEEPWDMLTNTMFPLRRGLKDWTDQEKKEIRVTLNNEIIPAKLKFLDAVLQGSKSGYFLDKISIADLKVHTFYKWLQMGILDHVSTADYNLPGIEKMVDMVDKHPAVVKWFAEGKVSK